MESRLRFLALSMFACVLGCGNALSEPALSDRPKTVKIQFENADAIRLDCDEKDTCDFSIDVFGKKFNLSKSDTGIEDPLIAHTVVLTPISSADLLYYVKVSSFCRKADFFDVGKRSAQAAELLCPDQGACGQGRLAGVDRGADQRRQLASPACAE